MPATYWALKYLRHSLLLLHHVEVLPEVRRHVPLPQVVGVVLVDAVKVPLFVRHAGKRRGRDHPWAGSATHGSACSRAGSHLEEKRRQVSGAVTESDANT